MRTMTIILAFILVGVSLALAVRYNQTAVKSEKALTSERYLRMVAEENLETTKSKVESLETELSRTVNKLSVIEKTLEQSKTLNNDLRTRLKDATDRQAKLEQQVHALEKLTQQRVPSPSGT